MARKTTDFTGQRFGRLKVVERISNPWYAVLKPGSYWLCICDCGAYHIVNAAYLKDGSVKSCGCYKKELNEYKDDIPSHFKRERLYGIWKGMHARCSNSNYAIYQYYGAKGICVCDDWNSYLIFRQWALNNGYDDKLTIDRIDCTLDYEPGNCRWVTHKENMRNRTNTIFLTYKNQTKSLGEWSEEYNIPWRTAYMNWYRGMPIESILKEPFLK